MGTLVWSVSEKAVVVSDGVVPIFGELSIWYLIPAVFVVLWIALKIAVSKGVFLPSLKATQGGGSGASRVAAVDLGIADPPILPNDFDQLIGLIGEEAKCANQTLQLRAERLSRLISHAEVVISQFQSHRGFSVQGESVMIEDLASIPPLGVALSVVDGRSDEEKTIQSKIEDLVASGTDPQQISELTGRPIGEILVICRLLQRKWQQST